MLVVVRQREVSTSAGGMVVVRLREVSMSACGLGVVRQREVSMSASGMVKQPAGGKEDWKKER